MRRPSPIELFEIAALFRRSAAQQSFEDRERLHNAAKAIEDRARSMVEEDRAESGCQISRDSFGSIDLRI